MPPRLTSSRASSNCGLIKARITPSGVSNSKALGKIKVSEMNETSITQIWIGSGISCAGKSPRIGFFEGHDPRVVPDFPGQLAMADVDREDLAAPRAAAGNR